MKTNRTRKPNPPTPRRVASAGLMTTTCPAGHQSATTDYCDECGLRMSGTPDLGATTELSLEPVTASTQSTGEPCPVCGTARVGRDQFCEECGYDFVRDRAACRRAPLRRRPRHGRSSSLPTVRTSTRSTPRTSTSRRTTRRGNSHSPRKRSGWGVTARHATSSPRSTCPTIPRTTGSRISTSSSCAPTTGRTPWSTSTRPTERRSTAARRSQRRSSRAGRRRPDPPRRVDAHYGAAGRRCDQWLTTTARRRRPTADEGTHLGASTNFLTRMFAIVMWPVAALPRLVRAIGRGIRHLFGGEHRLLRRIGAIAASAAEAHRGAHRSCRTRRRGPPPDRAWASADGSGMAMISRRDAVRP